MNSKWTDIINCINQFDKIVILTHTNMDGDAIGSASALCYLLRYLKKDAYILLEDTIPEYLSILSKRHPDYYVDSLSFTPELAIAVDCGDESRIEKRVGVYKSAKKRICIDHHIQTGEFAEYSYVEPDIAATSLLIYELIKEMNAPLDKELAEYLYSGISTDTGSFKFRNTNSKTHQVVADLYNYGIEADSLCNALYAAYPLEQLKLEGYAIEHVEVFANGKAGLAVVTQDDLKRFNAKYEHADTVIERVRSIEGVEISCVIKETDDGKYKASLRAKEYADVNKVASNLGGGGHLRASGCTFTCSLEETIAKIKKEIELAL